MLIFAIVGGGMVGLAWPADYKAAACGLMTVLEQKPASARRT